MIALIGGNEFRENCREMDRAILARLGASARVLVLPTAAANESPRQAANHGVAHLKRLGAKAEPLFVTQRDHANSDSMAAAIKEAEGVYFTGGDPVHLLETLRGTKVWRAVVELSERGGRLRGIAIVAGSSAGAMVMGGQTWAPGEGWREGLGLVPGVAVIPHHATVAARWNAAKMQESLAPGVTLVGIDEATAILFPDHLVLGEGEVTVYTPEPKVYESGKMIAEKLDSRPG